MGNEEEQISDYQEHLEATRDLKVHCEYLSIERDGWERQKTSLKRYIEELSDKIVTKDMKIRELEERVELLESHG